MLDPQVVVNLLPEFEVSVDVLRHGNGFGEMFKCGAERFLQSLGGMVDQRCRRQRVPKAN